MPYKETISASRLLRILIPGLIFLLLAASAHAGPKVIVSGHPDYPPIMWQQGDTITGAAVRLIRTIFDDLDVPYEVRYTGPWKRVQKNAEKGIVDVIVAAYRNPEREAYLDYSIPFLTDPVVVFVRTDNIFDYSRWEDLIGKRGNTNIGESYGSRFDRFIEKHLVVERVPKTVHNFMKLVAGRTDYAIIGLYPGLASAYIHGYKDKVTYLPKPVIEENFYVTFSKKSRYRHLLPRVNDRIKALRAAARIDKWVTTCLSAYYREHPVQAPAGSSQ